MTAPGNYALLITLLAAFVACTGYAAGRLHQWYRTGLDRDEAYRDGYDTATRSTFSLAARIIGPRRDSAAMRASARCTHRHASLRRAFLRRASLCRASLARSPAPLALCRASLRGREAAVPQPRRWAPGRPRTSRSRFRRPRRSIPSSGPLRSPRPGSAIPRRGSRGPRSHPSSPRSRRPIAARAQLAASLPGPIRACRAPGSCLSASSGPSMSCPAPGVHRLLGRVRPCSLPVPCCRLAPCSRPAPRPRPAPRHRPACRRGPRRIPRSLRRDRRPPGHGARVDLVVAGDRAVEVPAAISCRTNSCERPPTASRPIGWPEPRSAAPRRAPTPGGRGGRGTPQAVAEAPIVLTGGGLRVSIGSMLTAACPAHRWLTRGADQLGRATSSSSRAAETVVPGR